MTEHLYDRDNPKSVLRGKSTGIEGLFYGVPNINERAEMIYRSLLKHSDGDVTKFVNQSQKPRDQGQKWRTFKNIARFYKNPFAYIHWKIRPFVSENRFRILYFYLFANILVSFVNYVSIKNEKEGMVFKFMHSKGFTNKNYHYPDSAVRFPADRHKNYLRYSNFHQKLRPRTVSFIKTPFWCRDQNFRKYFEMRKKYGKQPSMTGFYHEPIYEAALKHHTEWSKKRSMRISESE